MSLLHLSFLHPLQVATSGALHEMNHVVSPWVHAVEGPINNVIHDSEEVVGGLYRASRGLVGMLPYVVGGWLVWSAFEMYFPEEYRTVYRTMDNAAKRLRLR